MPVLINVNNDNEQNYNLKYFNFFSFFLYVIFMKEKCCFIYMYTNIKTFFYDVIFFSIFLIIYTMFFSISPNAFLRLAFELCNSEIGQVVVPLN